MALEILFNGARTHENEQFRRVVEIIEKTFSELGYEGLLIGNPNNDNFHRFRADAILYYSNGIVIIDFKDFSGTVELPSNPDDFNEIKWKFNNEIDRSLVNLKAGNHFSNQFRQLKYYREAFYEIITQNPYLNGYLNPSKVCIINIFTGPITIINKIPGKFPYYKIVGESTLAHFLHDFKSENHFDNNVALALKKVFPAEKWFKGLSLKPAVIEMEHIISINENVEGEINKFLSKSEGGVLVLKSKDTAERDNWLQYILASSVDFDLSVVETLCHSSRISRKIEKRIGIRPMGLYGHIYGGSKKISGIDNEKIENDETDEELLEIIPVRGENMLEQNALLIVHEAHLLSRSYNRSDLLQFGSGRLLEDFMTYIGEENRHKIIFIGDPYSLSYGKVEDSALNTDTLAELTAQSISVYKSPLLDDYSNGKEHLINNLAAGIENSLYNNLDYQVDERSLFIVEREQIAHKLSAWFSSPLFNEPDHAFLFYKKSDALKTNIWIKNKFLSNGSELASGDLLVVSNNAVIPDPTGQQIPTSIVNGMYFTLLEIVDNKTEPIAIRQKASPVVLSFTKIKVKCLSVNNKPETEVWMLDNYFRSEDDLSKEESVAFQMFINNSLYNRKKEFLFKDSIEYKKMLEDQSYINLSIEEKGSIRDLIQNYDKKKEDKLKVSTTQKARGILSSYNEKYTQRIFSEVKNNDPFVNALKLNYGWALTAHKALGSIFNEIIIKGHRKDSDGVTNESYYRWLYSAVSTAESAVHITHPQRINPFMKAEFRDLCENWHQKEIAAGKPLLFFRDYVPGEYFSSKISEVTNPNVIGAACEIGKLLEREGLIVEKIYKKGDFLSAVEFSVPMTSNGDLLLFIDNKGPKDNFAVTNIRINRLNNFSREIVDEKIEMLQYLFADKKPKETNNDNSRPQYIDDIYSSWYEKLKNESIDLKIIESHKNQDIFQIKNEEKHAKFRVWYGTSADSHTKGFISKIELLEKSDDDLVPNIQNLLL